VRYFIRFSLAFVLSACALGMYPSRLPAEEKSPLQGKPFPEKLAALLDDETLCVVHVDFTQIDTDAVLDNARAFVDRLFDKVKLTEADRESLRAALEASAAQAPLKQQSPGENWKGFSRRCAGRPGGVSGRPSRRKILSRLSLGGHPQA
jgi:hypothetical protein